MYSVLILKYFLRYKKRHIKGDNFLLAYQGITTQNEKLIKIANMPHVLGTITHVYQFILNDLAQIF